VRKKSYITKIKMSKFYIYFQFNRLLVVVTVRILIVNRSLAAVET